MKTARHFLYTDFYATDDGRIFRDFWRGKKREPKEMNQWKNQFGYVRFTVSQNRDKRNLYVHKFILECFFGEAMDGQETSHIDGIRSNNTLSNLTRETRKQNHARKKEHGTDQVGENNGHSKLKDIDCYRIRHFIEIGVKQRTIARCFGVSEQCISDVKLKKRYAHV